MAYQAQLSYPKEERNIGAAARPLIGKLARLFSRNDRKQPREQRPLSPEQKVLIANLSSLR